MLDDFFDYGEIKSVFISGSVELDNDPEFVIGYSRDELWFQIKQRSKELNEPVRRLKLNRMNNINILVISSLLRLLF